VLIAFPALVTGGIEKTVAIDADKALQMMQDKSNADRAAPSALPLEVPGAPASAASEGAGASAEKEDPMQGLLDSMKKDEAKKP
jgi:hypothetical protein